jgi:uncharacterized membrane protein
MRGGYALPGQPPGAPPGIPSLLAPRLAPQATPSPNATGPVGWGNSSLGMAATHAAGLSYCGWWLTGLLIYFNERQSRFVRFHALQSTISTGILTIASVLAYVVASLLNDAYLATHQHVYDTLSKGVALLAFVVILICWLALMAAAFAGVMLRIPFIAPYAERYAPPVPPDYGELGGP